jgi:hypothetical protein
MTSTTIYNRNDAQVSVKADDEHSYWVPPKSKITIPTTVNRTKLPPGVRVIKDPSTSPSA